MLQPGEKLEGGERTTQKRKAGGRRFWIGRRDGSESAKMRRMRVQGSNEKENKAGVAKGMKGRSLDSTERGKIRSPGLPHKRGSVEGRWAGQRGGRMRAGGSRMRTMVRMPGINEEGFEVGANWGAAWRAPAIPTPRERQRGSACVAGTAPRSNGALSGDAPRWEP